MSLTALRIIVVPCPSRPGAFTGRLEDGSLVVTSSRQPLVDSARELLAHGFDPETPLAMRHVGKSYDSFAKPAPIGELARWTYSEPDSEPLRRRLWKADCRRPAASYSAISGVGDLRDPQT
ncbi:hypothetical protein [Reyranella sp.]|uniref:hypothetical protein n=1 Tax=Reyranella sp. TaxID=1929291 RepID=UPI00378493C6